MERVGRRNKAVVSAARLHRARHRKIEGLTLIEGPHLLAEAVAAGIKIGTLFTLAEDESSRALADDGTSVILNADALRRLTGTKNPRGPIATIEIPVPTPLTARSTFVAWGVSDPGNVGTMIRIAAAFGFAFGYYEGSADPWSPKVLRSGVGGQFRIPVTPVTGVSQLRAAGLGIVATVVAAGDEPETLPTGPFAVLIGEEADGLPREILVESDHRVTIPMPGGTESLNAGVSAGILAYVLSKHIGEVGQQG
jgi:TrmH family RNA methyltransferase